MKKFLFILIFFFSFLSLFFSCDDSTGPPNNNAKLNLILEDVSCTEVWLKLQVDNPAIKSDVIIYRDNVEIKKINNIIGNDTIIFDEGLLPNKEYTYRAKKIISESESIESEEIKAQTMDTTSHNFTFETFTFGEHSSSVLYDVAIVNENCIWAVGEIYLNDSLGNPDPNRYNLAKWDGSVWSIIRIPYYYQGEPFYHPIQSVFAFGPNDIWFCGNGVIHWDGKNFIPISIPTNVWGPYQMNKIWGTSSNDIYIVGDGGNIAHYQNGVWRKIESGTELSFVDIYGITETKTTKQDIYCIASDKYFLVDKKVLKINNNNVTEVLNKGLSWSLSSIWFNSKYKIYIVGDGIFVKNLLINNYWQNIVEGITTYYTHSIRGNETNDIIVSGAGGELIHFNGMNWYSYRANGLPTFYGNYYSTTIRYNIICAVGQAVFENNKAIIALGFR